MSKNEKNWIVLINKIPRGPFTEEDLKILIQDNIIKKSDLVIEHQKNKEQSAQWIFVWQALELDEPDFEKKRAKTERKEPVTLSEPIQPEELHKISPEDLLVKSEVKHFDTELKFKKEEEVVIENSYSTSSSVSYRSLVFPFMAVIGIALSIQYLFKIINENSTSSQKMVAEPSEPAVTTPMEAPQPIAKRRNLASPNSPKAKVIPKENNNLLNIPQQPDDPRPPVPDEPAPMRDQVREQEERNLDETKADEGEVELDENVPVAKRKQRKVNMVEEGDMAEEGQAGEEENPGSEEEGPGIPKN